MTLEKLTIPLTIAASVIAIAVFLRGGKVQPVTGSVPLAMPVPTFAAIPYNPTNAATPVPPTFQPAITPAPYVPFVSRNGVVVNRGFGAAFSSDTVGGDNCVCACGSGSCSHGNGDSKVYPFYSQISQSAVL